jgi:hypothetical protein
VGESITLGFDGSLNDDTTVLRGCRMSDGFLFKIGAWAKPDGAAGAGWEVPRLEVLARSARRSAATTWSAATSTRTSGAATSRRWPRSSAKSGSSRGVLNELLHAVWRARWTVCHSGSLSARSGTTNELAAEHYGNAYVDMRGRSRLVRKEYPNSPRKIDSVVGDALALEARADALAAGWGQPKPKLTRVKGRASAR